MLRTDAAINTGRMPSLARTGNTVEAPLLLALGLPLPLFHPGSIRARGIGNLQRKTALVVEQPIRAVAVRHRLPNLVRSPIGGPLDYPRAISGREGVHVQRLPAVCGRDLVVSVAQVYKDPLLMKSVGVSRLVHNGPFGCGSLGHLQRLAALLIGHPVNTVA